jgi:type II secretory pathway pseudopilin PulG
MRSLVLAARRRLSLTTRSTSRDAGISLVELLVSVMIFLIILVLVASMYSAMSRTVSIGNSANQSTKTASNAMNEISRVVRFASTNGVLNSAIPTPAVSLAGPKDLTVISFVDANAATPKPITVSFTVDASNRLVEKRFAATLTSGFWIFSAIAYSTRVLASGVLDPSAGQDPLFSYQDVNGDPPTAFADIAAVMVTVKLKGDTTSTAQPVILQNTVGMPNLGLNRTGQ